MSIFLKYKKPIIITSIVIVSIVMLILILQIIASNIVENKIVNALSTRDANKYNIEVGKAKVNLFTMTLILKDVEVIPDSLFMEELRNSQTKHEDVFHITIPVLRVRNIGVFDLLLDKFANVGEFVIKGAKIEMFTDGKKSPAESKDVQKTNPKFSLDSIPIKGIGGGEIGKVVLSDFGINVINIEKEDTVFSARSLNLTIDGISLLKNDGDSVSFNLKVNDLDVKMENEQFLLPGGKYLLSFGEMHYKMQDSLLIFNDLKIIPRYSQSYMVSLSKFQYEIYNVGIDKAEIKSINLRSIIQSKKIYLSSVEIEKLQLNIFKDKRLPFDESKRPKLPQQMLKEMKQDMYIDSIVIRNSELIYSERHKLMKEPMAVTLGDFNVKVNNVTSVLDSIMEGNIMTINLVANLQKTIPMEVNIIFPLKSVSDTFSFSGHLGSGDVQIFNAIVLPVLGMKFETGYIDGIDFTAHANPVYSVGEMTMLYHSLKGDVQKQDMAETNKFLSWLANSVLLQNNPIKDKDPRAVPLYFDRVIYKGAGNYLWKTLQSGIMATIIPTVENRVQHQIDTRLGTDKKAINKRERNKKREERKDNKNK